ncbi:MAG: hypothetical protein JXA30_02595 [Deltaproteobacteria bacterium]|nr:hypothetical protein [Deltaproteobacteria bacterium]
MVRNSRFSFIERMPRARFGLFAVAAVFAAAPLCCDLNHPGEEPRRAELYYPISVTLAPSQDDENEASDFPKYLFVVNSNFDLRYNAGSVQAFDLDSIFKKTSKCEKVIDKCREDVDECEREFDACLNSCGKEDEKCLEECERDDPCSDLCDPYALCHIDPAEVLADEVLIGSFAATATFSPGGKRLYVPTRSNTSLSYIDVDAEADGDRVLSCGEGSSRRCGDDYVRGDEALASVRRIELSGESVGAVVQRLKLVNENAREDLDYVLVAQRNGSVSFFVSPDKNGPELVYMIDKFQTEVTNIGLDPITGYAYLTSRETITTGNRKSLQRVGIFYDLDELTSFIYDAGLVFLRGVSAERDTRDIAFSPFAPDRAFVVSRTPNALLVVDFSSARTGNLEAIVNRTVKVGSGASRVVVGRIGNDPRLFAFVSCFGSRELFVIDVDLGEPVAVIQGFSGPFELALDRWRKKIYVADFRSSIVRIVDLEPIVCVPESEDDACQKNQTSRIVATLGEPRPPEELI